MGGGFPDRDPPVDRQTPVKTKPSQNSFAGGNNGKSKRVHDCNFTPFVGNVLLSVADRGSSFFSSQEILRLFQYLCDFSLTFHRPKNVFIT